MKIHEPSVDFILCVLTPRVQLLEQLHDNLVGNQPVRYQGCNQS